MSRTPIPGLKTAAAVALLTLCGLAAHADSSDPQSRAVTDMRSVGTAMFKWYKAELKPRRQKAAPQDSDAKTADVSHVPVIAHDDLAKLLVPKYLAAVPKNDPWGHPYEYRLSQDPEADEVMAVRSAGADGKFAGTQYEISGFPPAEKNQDLVWMDGYFVRWPAKAK